MDAITSVPINHIRNWLLAHAPTEINAYPSAADADNYICDRMRLIATLSDVLRRDFCSTLDSIVSIDAHVPVAWHDALDIHLRLHLYDWLADYSNHKRPTIKAWVMIYLQHTNLEITDGISAAHWFILSAFEIAITQDDANVMHLDHVIGLFAGTSINPITRSAVTTSLFPHVFAYVTADVLTSTSSPVFVMDMIDILIDAGVSYSIANAGRIPPAIREIYRIFTRNYHGLVDAEQIMKHIMITTRTCMLSNTKYPITGAHLVTRFTLNATPYSQHLMHTGLGTFTTTFMIVLRSRLLTPRDLYAFAVYFRSFETLYLTVDGDNALSYIAKHYSNEYIDGFRIVLDAYVTYVATDDLLAHRVLKMISECDTEFANLVREQITD